MKGWELSKMKRRGLDAATMAGSFSTVNLSPVVAGNCRATASPSALRVSNSTAS